jgi:uncharacterized protein (UPF0335 family)
MENEKADRLKIMLEQALQPIVERLDRIEAELKALKEQDDK